jgi:hypothetical protein
MRGKSGQHRAPYLVKSEGYFMKIKYTVRAAENIPPSGKGEKGV